MLIIFDWKKLIVLPKFPLQDSKFLVPATCKVRTLLNGQRQTNEIVKSFSRNGSRIAYDPRQFPSGIFNITGVEWTEDPEFAPVKIKTDAVRPVYSWKTENGIYKKVTTNVVQDFGYWMHYCLEFKTTLGCIRIGSPANAIKLGKMIEPLLDKNKKICLEVL